MKIQFVWQNPVTSDQTAKALAGAVSASVNLALMASDKWLEQTLTLEAPGISGQIRAGMKGTSYYIRDIQASLLGYGIKAQVFINGMSIQDYAALEETRLEFLKFHAQKTIDELKATRSWLKAVNYETPFSTQNLIKYK